MRHLLLLGAGDNEVLLHLNQDPTEKRMEPFPFQWCWSLNFRLELSAVFRVLTVASGENIPGTG